MRILSLTWAFPSSVNGSAGVFVKERLKALNERDDFDLRVVYPIPYFPRLPLGGKWSKWAEFPAMETVEGIPVYFPRYVLPPKLGGYFAAELMWRSVSRCVERIHSEFPFDLIDAHWTYPTGVLASKLGARWQCPVTVTGRGEDILRFPGLPRLGPAIRQAVPRFSHCVALSPEIARAYQTAGARADRITVIPNGVDCEKFYPVKDAKQRLGLPTDRKIVVSVGNCQERKGFHLLVDAFAQVRRQHPDSYLVIVGGKPPYGEDYTEEINRRIEKQGLQDHVRMAGHCPHAELATWYSAGDVFALLSSREGSPNVLLEALACGVPSVATPVGGIPDELADERLGILLKERSVAEAVRGLNEAFDRPWDRQEIRRVMEERSWQKTADRVARVFHSCREASQPQLQPASAR